MSWQGGTSWHDGVRRRGRRAVNAAVIGAGQAPLVSASDTFTDVALAVAKIGAVVIGLLLVSAMFLRATLGRFRRVRNLLRLQPSVTVEPAAAGGTDELRNLPSLLQSVLGNLGADVGGQNIQFVSPSSDDVSELALPASAPAQLEYLTWVVALVRPLAPKDRVTVRLTVQPEGRQGLGMTAALVGGPRGRTINSTTLWEADIGLDGIADDEPVLGERERYQLLAAPLAAWVYFTLADLTQTDRQLVGTRNWRSYGQFSLGCRLYKTHRQRGQRLLREAIDADPDNFGAHLNILLLEFDGRRTASGKEQLELLRIEVEARPGVTFCPRNVAHERPRHWYDPTWYRTMYSFTAVCSHMVSEASNHPEVRSSGPEVEAVRTEGEEAAMDLVGACWIALNDLLPGKDGRPEGPRRGRGKKARLRYRQRQELALFLGQMLPSAVLLLVNLRLLDSSMPVAGALAAGSRARVAGPPDQRKAEWERRNAVLRRLDPKHGRRRTCPDMATLLSAIDPVEFLPGRARYNVACVCSEVAQYQDRTRPDAAEQAARSREWALQELEKGLDHDSAQWAREDPALWEVRTNHTTRPRFAQLVAEELNTPIEWSILHELPFIGVAGAARLWIGGGITHARSLRELDDESRRALLDNPTESPWLDAAELATWTERAALRAHLSPRLGDAETLDRVENLLYRLGITTGAELSASHPWPLSRRLVELAGPDGGADGVLTPSAVEVWAR